MGYLYMNSDEKGRNLKCKCCVMFQDKIKVLPKFSDIVIRRSTNYCKSVLKDHGRSKKVDVKHFHMVAYDKYLSTKIGEVKSQSKKFSGDCKQTEHVVSSFGNMTQQTFFEQKIESETTYFAVKNEIPISTWKNIVRLEQKYDV